MNNYDGLCFPSSSDLIDQVFFDVDHGKIWLTEQRMLLVHSAFFWQLRRELIGTLGEKRARAAFMRLGYNAGLRDAEVARKIRPEISKYDSFMAGPQLALLKGMVSVEPVNLDFNIIEGKFYGEFIWKDAFEADLHLANNGRAELPVCWILLGYSSGFTSYYMGREVFFKEVSCTAMGDEVCRIIGKPIEEWDDCDELKANLLPDNILEELEVVQLQLADLKGRIPYTAQETLFDNFVGESRVYKDACKLVSKAAAGEVTVLLQGETGVGKEVFAKALHDGSLRADKPFVAVNCGAIPPDLIEAELFGVEKGAFTGALSTRCGRFERANGGTLFLDEVAELTPRAQSALLRALQEREIERVGGSRTIAVDVRLVAATHVDLALAVEVGTFRKDLYYRLNVYPIRVPSLRERKEDIPALVDYFIDHYKFFYKKNINKVSDKALKAIMLHNWPGNIRELENSIERAVILTDNNTSIDSACFAYDSGSSSMNISKINMQGEIKEVSSQGRNYADPTCEKLLEQDFNFEDFERKLYLTALTKASGNMTEAARCLGISRPQLAYRLEKLKK